MAQENLDPHLNLFRKFGLSIGEKEYENNVTHALINTLRLSDPRVTRALLAQLVPEVRSISVDWTDIGWSLQRPPRSPEGFQNRLVLGISVDGYVPQPGQSGIQKSAPENVNLKRCEDVSTTPEEQVRGIPDAWIYTKQTDSLCVLIEVKTRGGIDPDQTSRHEATHFGERGATLRKLDLKWRELSHAADRAYREHPNAVGEEFLTFLSLEGLAATFRFDDATIRLTGSKLPRDVTSDLVNRLGKQLNVGNEHLVAWPDWQPHVLIFRNFQAVGNIEVWLDGQPPHTEVVTLLSFGTATPRVNLLGMPEQVERLLISLENYEIQDRAIRAIENINPSPVWTVLDRLQRAMMPNWYSRNENQIGELLQAAGRTSAAEASGCFGEEHLIAGGDLRPRFESHEAGSRLRFG